MERRTFLKTTCTLCGIAGLGMFMSSLSSCSPLPIYKTAIADNKISIPLSLFATNELQIIRVKNVEYDIAVRKINDQKYIALLMQCTHADNQLVSTGKGFLCNSHGSNFDQEGTVTKGPAERSLRKFTTEINGDQLFIHI